MPQVNCILLAMDNHGVKDGSTFRQALDNTDIAFAVFFACEAAMKLFAWGVWGCGRRCVRVCVCVW